MMVLNALAVDPRRKWKGVWRWFDESLLDCCVALPVVQQQGIVFAEWLCLAQCNGLDVDDRPGGTFTLEDFRDILAAQCKQDGSLLVVSYSRKAVWATATSRTTAHNGTSACPTDCALLCSLPWHLSAQPDGRWPLQPGRRLPCWEGHGASPRRGTL
mmetsp:Transcript_2978/g.8393  ORF Transcript_2978/g.8393 Transcript_2978/m.8393 type:complete len:157 (-) Transcript_2978:896-1366(-)